MIENTVELVTAELRATGALEGCESVELRRAAEPYADLALHFADGGWRATPAGSGLIDRLAAAAWCGSSRAKGRRLTLRVTDAYVAELGRALESGEPLGLACGDLLAGRTLFVDFYGANSTKALHIGHLRNLAVGNACAAALRAAGARVITQSHASDFGRQMSEAMAGYVRFHDGRDPASEGMKPDHFVGDCYSRYVAQLEDRQAAAPADAPIARELAPASDLAEELQDRLRAGDPEIRAIWSRLRGWAISGQAETLARLGISLDRMRYESESLELGERIVADGLARGILERTADGAVVYAANRAEYRQMMLVRADGMPTAHLRDFICLGVIMRSSPEPLDAYIQFCGDEWANAVPVYRELLARLRPEPFNERHHMIFHGLVTRAGAKLASSAPEPSLADELLDQMANSAPVVALAAAGPSPEILVRIIVLGHLASAPPTATLELGPGSLLEKDGPGWQLARAYARCAAASGVAEPSPADPAYRFAVLQSQRLRQAVASVTTQYDPSRVVRFLIHLSRWYLEAPASAAIDRIVRTVFHRGLPCAGLGPAAADRPSS